MVIICGLMICIHILRHIITGYKKLWGGGGGLGRGKAGDEMEGAGFQNDRLLPQYMFSFFGFLPSNAVYTKKKKKKKKRDHK